MNNRKRALGIAVVLALVIFLGSALIVRMNRNKAYMDALNLYNARKYEEAIVLFEELKNYQFSKEYSEACKKELNYEKGKEEYENGNYAAAAALFLQLMDYKDGEKLFEESVSSIAQMREEYNPKMDDEEEKNLDLTDNDVVILTPTESVANLVSTAYKDDFSDEAPIWNVNEVFASDYDGDKYTVGELSKQEILLHYEEDGQDVYFYGKNNEKGQWDGECIINVFRNDQLVISTKAFYNNGYRVRYEQLIPEQDSYIYSKREQKKTENIGDSWKFVKRDEMINMIDLKAFDRTQLVDPSDYKAMENVLICHYHGNTRDGKYNDETGKSYYVSFYDDGTVRTLYYGNFKDGRFNDYTRNAWYVTRNKDNNTKYMYFRGVFKEGSASKNKIEIVDFQNPASKEYVENLVVEYSLDDDLIWEDSCF